MLIKIVVKLAQSCYLYSCIFLLYCPRRIFSFGKFRLSRRKDSFDGVVLPNLNKFVTRSDKMVTKCGFGHSELLISTESAIKELYN